ncbi:tyrosine-type recombinase/integrase [Streptomyces sp. NPDC001732]
MATPLVRGLGSFFKNCRCTRQNRCAHPYVVRYRDGTGRQREETGFTSQQDALDRLTKVYDEKRHTPERQAASRCEIGRHRFGPYAASWLARQRHCTSGSIRTVDQVPKSQVLPVPESRRINTFTSTVIDDFIMSMEERSVGLGAQQNAYDTLKKILLDAHRRGGTAEDPFIDVASPEYIPRKITTPTLDEIRALKTQRSLHWGHSTMQYQWRSAKKKAGITRKLNPYSRRHFFASNCLSKGVPITDVAEWMGHSNINLTSRIYRHLTPTSVGRAARLLKEEL